jgi:hypothetical protein
MSAVEAAVSFGVTLLSAVASVGVTLVVMLPLVMGFVSTVGALASAVGILGVGLWKIGGLIVNAFGKAASGAIGGLKKDLGALGSAFSGFGSYFAGWGGLFGKLASDGSAAFGRLAGDVTSAFSGIQDAIASEQWGLAWRIMKDTFLIAWGEISNVLAGSWDGIMSQLGKAWAGVWYAAMTGWDWLLSEMKIGWMSLGVTVQGLWASILGEIAKTLFKMWDALSESGLLGAAMSAPLQAAAWAISDAAEAQGKSADESSKALPDRIAGERAARDASTAGRRTQADAQAKAAEENLKGILGTPGTPQADIDAARKDLAAAIAAAKEARAKADAEAKAKLAGAGAGGAGGVDLEAAKGPKGSVRGTFSASAAAGMGTGGVMGDIAKATKQTANDAHEQLKLLTNIDWFCKQVNFDLAAAP